MFLTPSPHVRIPSLSSPRQEQKAEKKQEKQAREAAHRREKREVRRETTPASTSRGLKTIISGCFRVLDSAAAPGWGFRGRFGPICCKANANEPNSGPNLPGAQARAVWDRIWVCFYQLYSCPKPSLFRSSGRWSVAGFCRKASANGP